MKSVLVDMNLSPEWISYLAERGVQAVHWSEVGKFDAQDAEIFNYARCHEMIIFTHDMDFTAMLALSRAHRPSLIQARVQDVSPKTLGPFFIQALRECADQLERGAIVTLLPDRHKVRVLPL